ncbi:MAG TPA: hypothetical protein VGB08_10805 [Allosphingosinicella sp.]|jgi:hypothetical protein
MAVLIPIAAAAAAFAAAGDARLSETVELSGSELRVRDLAAVEGFAGLARGPAGPRIVAALPDGRAAIVTSRAALAALVRRSVPGIAIEVGDGDRPVTIRRRHEASAPAGRCAALAAPVEAGGAIAGEDLVEVPCEAGAAAAAVRFDRSTGNVRAAGDLDAGAYLGRLVVADGAAVEAGAALTLVSTVGPVTVARPVVAMQTGRRGARLFVRDEDGQVFAVRFDRGGEAGR